MSNLQYKLHIFEIVTLNTSLRKDSVLSCAKKISIRTYDVIIKTTKPIINKRLLSNTCKHNFTSI